MEYFISTLAFVVVQGGTGSAGGMNKSDPKYQTLPYNTKFPPMVVHSASQAPKVTKGQATEVKVAPVPPPKPTTSSAR